jgi:hypothetical protein
MRVAHRIESYSTSPGFFHICKRANASTPRLLILRQATAGIVHVHPTGKTRPPDYAHAAPRHLDEKALGRNSRAKGDTECVVEAQD